MKKILIVIDMQNDFTSGALGNDACEAVVPRVCDIIKFGNYDDIILTRDTHDEDYLKSQEGKNLPVTHCIRGTDGWQIRQEILDAIGNLEYTVFDKPTFGSVELACNLDDYIDDIKDTEVDIVGVCTGICVISNALLIKAFYPELKINVIADACACASPESHQTALDAMKLCQINIK